MESYNDVKKYVESLEEDLKSELDTLDKKIIAGRDSANVPIYSTKFRIKKPGSVYLKKKRKKKNLEEINDYAGMRVLCLFEQDIPELHKYLLQIYKDKSYNLVEVKIYNWPRDEYPEFNSKIDSYLEESKYNEIKAKNVSKGSGYKSIHYIIQFSKSRKDHPIEIQLRTLFQDVWGELEHSLSYKQGAVHPHIKECFDLLAKDIEANDNLMNHLKEIHNNEKFREMYSVQSAGPFKYLDYDVNLVEKIKEKSNSSDPCDSYIKFVSEKANNHVRSDLWIEDAKKLFEQMSMSFDRQIEYKISHEKTLSKDVEIFAYFFDMEAAFLKFCEGNLEDALAMYNKCQKKFPKYYVPYFRAGEILFIMAEYPEAISAFDIAKTLMKDDTLAYHNRYKVKSKIAHVYWQLGPEYIDYAIENIRKAEEFFCCAPEGTFNEKHKRALKNNVTYYLLEKYIYFRMNPEEIEKNFSEFYKELNGLTEFYKTVPDDLSSNLLDTLAWGWYNVYLKDGSSNILNDAKKYCKEMIVMPNQANFMKTSHNLQVTHFTTIMRT
ncbi:MAG: hypothetical protein CVU55_05900 [Deltaproteobacteria bacterium HGW-Deltaproteobacteria-13]|jgi:ppGpp synthetase/RelA/SpoT-type nucleotidyltranferase|nr:MAG: hypothetical protein CVU55_05900 [Deltaproteobacteria bacterium HGW-Deltaproteobacteria-13]